MKLIDYKKALDSEIGPTNNTLEYIIKFIKLYKTQLIAAVILLWFMGQMQAWIGCGYQLNQNMTVYGNCQQIIEYEEAKTRSWIQEREQIALMEYDNTPIKIRYLNSTTTTSKPTTTTTCPPQRVCPDNYCECEICTECPQCSYELSDTQNKWFLNLKPTGGASGYQAGYHDCADNVREYLKIPGRPKFKSRPPTELSPYGWGQTKSKEEGMYCFRDLGGYYIVNRTPHIHGNISRPRWGWNDASCKSSVIRINHL